LVKKTLIKLRTPFLVLLAFFAVFIAGFLLWASNPLGPMEEALSALESDHLVRVNYTDGIEFTPENTRPTAGFIFYPGGRVDPRSYAPFARQIAEEGYLVVIVPMPLNLAVFAPNRAGQVIQAHPDIQFWTLGGHSLGGAMAASFTGNNLEQVTGLSLWASYPPGSTDLSTSGLTAVSIYGSEDRVLNSEQFEQSRHLLPPGTNWMRIEGGNHAQFGWYGLQPGDGEALISRQEQQDQVVSATLDLLIRIDRRDP
jgi:hypothetical protein